MTVFYQLRDVVFVDTCDLGEDQITFPDQLKDFWFYCIYLFTVKLAASLYLYKWGVPMTLVTVRENIVWSQLTNGMQVILL